MPLRLDPEFPLYEYACHEGNYAMFNMLKGARAEEAAKAGRETGIEGQETISCEKSSRLRTAAVGLLAVSPVWAHHSFAAEYDGKKQVHLEGVVTQMEWINPHTWIHIDVTDAGR